VLMDLGAIEGKGRPSDMRQKGYKSGAMTGSIVAIHDVVGPAH